MAVVSIRNLTKYFGTNRVLNNINLDVSDGTLISLLGPSGCGKTTTLRLIAGFEKADSGDIYIDGKRVNEINANKRNIGMVFQSYALFPHMTVEQNISYGLEQRPFSRDEIRERVAQIIQVVRLEGLEKRKPGQLSGGQQQRVALARALVIEPSILLLDECLSALDKKLRVEMQIELRRILESRKITGLLVTHDQEEAMTISDHIAVMNEGEIEQTGTPRSVYEYPRNSFVAGFLGKANFFEGKVLESDEDTVLLKTLYGSVRIATQNRKEAGSSAMYAVRPEKVRISSDSEQGSLKGTVSFVTYAGNISMYTVDWNGLSLLVEEQNTTRVKPISQGQTVYLSWDKEACHLMEDIVPSENSERKKEV